MVQYDKGSDFGNRSIRDISGQYSAYIPWRWFVKYNTRKYKFMITADWIALVAMLFFALLGAMVGFGRGLKFFTGGIFGVIISIFVTYLIFGFVLDIEFVSNLLQKFVDWLSEQNSVGSFFANIHIDYVVLAVILFIIVQIVRIIIVKIIRGVVEIENVVVKTINRIFGIILFEAVLVALVLFVFQIVAWVGGTTAENFMSYLDDSFLGLDFLFENNPLKSIFSSESEALASLIN